MCVCKRERERERERERKIERKRELEREETKKIIGAILFFVRGLSILFALSPSFPLLFP